MNSSLYILFYNFEILSTGSTTSYSFHMLLSCCCLSVADVGILKGHTHILLSSLTAILTTCTEWTTWRPSTHVTKVLYGLISMKSNLGNGLKILIFHSRFNLGGVVLGERLGK